MTADRKFLAWLPSLTAVLSFSFKISPALLQVIAEWCEEHPSASKSPFILIPALLVCSSSHATLGLTATMSSITLSFLLKPTYTVMGQNMLYNVAVYSSVIAVFCAYTFRYKADFRLSCCLHIILLFLLGNGYLFHL